ncbi:MAG: hydrogenase maturation protease [Elainellaceae cyanobacterium]
MNIASTSHPYLMIGYGNTLRCDDGVGYRVAEIVAGWNLAGVRSLSVHQLTPDLADDIAKAEVVLFVDAGTSSELAVESITPTFTERFGSPTGSPTGNFAEGFSGHYAEPRSLLCVTHLLYDTIPTAYRVLIPAVDFSFGETFSSVTQSNMSLALAKIKDLINLYA